jgi:tetratricopeptide (TPR) repeat protein
MDFPYIHVIGMMEGHRMPPMATVVVTAFDRKDSLRNLLEGLNGQSVGPQAFEVIIGDDSGDRCIGQEVIKHLPTAYNTSLVRTGLPYHVNGVSVARNRGIRKARGDIIISIDDDCTPGLFFIEEHLRAHSKPYPVIVLGHRSERKEKLLQTRPVPVTESKAISELIAGSVDQLNFSNFMTGNISFPKDIVLEAGLFAESFAQEGEHGWEDIELGYRLWRKGIPTLFSRNALVYRPPTERAKTEKRAAAQAMEKAACRFVGLQPLLPWVNQFLEAIRQDKTDLSIEIGEKILKDDPNHWAVLTKLGELHIHQGNLDEAERLLLKALELNDRNPFLYQKLAETKYRQEKDVLSLKYLVKALDLDSNRTGALYLLALLKPILEPDQFPPHLLAREINIELGGGVFPTKLREEGQDDYINLDVLNWPPVDVIHDMRESLLLPDNSVAHIFSREMIEHLPYKILPHLFQECYRVLRPGGSMYLACPDFESILSLYDRKCECVTGTKADSGCPRCKGKAVVSEDYWRANLLGAQIDYGDGGLNDTHKNQITFPYLETLLLEAGFVDIVRDSGNRFYEEYKRNIKLSVTCAKPSSNVIHSQDHDAKDSK